LGAISRSHRYRRLRAGAGKKGTARESYASFGQPTAAAAVVSQASASQHRLERSPSRCQSIAHAHWRARVDKPLHDALGLKLAQSLGENAVADSRDPCEQLVETSGAWKERLDDRSRPALAYQLYGALKGRAVVDTPSDHGE